MIKPTPAYLRVVDSQADAGTLLAQPAELQRLCRAFEAAVGWQLEYVGEEAANQSNDLTWSAPVDPGVGASLRLVRPVAGSAGKSKRPKVEQEQAARLAAGLAELWRENRELRKALAEREAELATGVPVVARREEPAKAAERLSSVLQAGAEAVGCQAAGLYLLDAATTSLKLRSCWGLPDRRLLCPPRPLRGALADLEALLGHAVVLSEPAMFDYWRAPEACGAAVCVPVSSATTQLGTLWMFSHMTRDFSDEQTNLIEVIAGRIAADLEREVLLADAEQSSASRRQLVTAGQQQIESLPRVVPSIDGWRVAGRAAQAGQVGRAFYDWFNVGPGVCAVALGVAVDEGFAGALVAAEVRSALRAQSYGLGRCDQALERAHEVLASLSAGGVGASALIGLLGPNGQVFRFARAGSIGALAVEPGGCRALEVVAPAGIGGLVTPSIVERNVHLSPGSLLVVYGWGVQQQPDPELRGSLIAGLTDALSRETSRQSERLADVALDVLRSKLPHPATDPDCSLLVIQRR